MSKWVWIALVGVIAIASAVTLFRGDTVVVQVGTVAPDTLSVSVAAEGVTRARERFNVVAPITGRLARIELDEGTSVREGQLLARIYPAPQDPSVVAIYTSELEAAEARSRQALVLARESELAAEQARREVERRRPLAEMGAMTREGLEKAELAAALAEERLVAAREDVHSARASLESARARLQGALGARGGSRPLEIRAPVAGQLSRLDDRSERVVVAGTPLLMLSEVSALEAVFDVLSEDAVRVEEGDEIVITGWGGDATIHGRVRLVTRAGYTEVSALGVEEQRVDVVGDLLDPPPAVGTGYRVSGEIVTWRGESVLTVPTGAVFRAGDSWRVFVVTGERARLRSVVLGHRNDRAAEVVDGLSEGERVVLFPSEAVGDGVRVRVIPGG